MKKVVRDLKKKVRKVSGTEQKILDATSNEPWGPHGTDLAEIAQASNNYQDYNSIMTVIWKRINDTGKNWRHVFKALTVLEHLVAHGNERVIDDIREHAHQLLTLGQFQYIDSSGRDQGINVRKKSQSLVTLVSDIEKIREVRQKAHANKDKCETRTGESHRRNSYSGGIGYEDDDLHRNRADERNGYYEDERSGRGRSITERYGSDASQDDNSRGRGSIDAYPECSLGDDDRFSRSGGKADDQSQTGRGLDVAARPSNEDVARNSQNSIQDERNKETVSNSSHNSSRPGLPVAPSSKGSARGPEIVVTGESMSQQSSAVDTFEEFDPRGSTPSAVQPAASSSELDIFGISSSDSADPSSSAPANNAHYDKQTNSEFGDFFAAPSSATASSSQFNEDPFGDSPFKATPQENVQSQSEPVRHFTSFQPSGSMGSSDTPQSAPQPGKILTKFEFGDALSGLAYAPNTVSGPPSASQSFLTREFPVEQSSDDILDSIFPRAGPSPVSSSQEAQPTTPLDAQTVELNPFQQTGFTAPAAGHGSARCTKTDQLSPYHPSGGFAPVVAQGSLTHRQGSGMNPFQLPALPAPAAAQGPSPDAQDFFQPSGIQALAGSQKPTTGMQTAQMSPQQMPGQFVPESSQGLPPNMSSQMHFSQPSGASAVTGSHGQVPDARAVDFNLPHSSEPPTPASSQGPPASIASQKHSFPQSGPVSPVASQQSATDADTAHLAYPEPSGPSVSAASQGSPTDMSSQMNFFHLSAPSTAIIPQNSVTDMQTAQSNFSHLSGPSVPSTSQGSQNNASHHMNTHQSSGPSPAASQGSPANTSSQRNFFHPSGQSTAVSQESPSNTSSQMNFFQPSGPWASVHSQKPVADVQTAQSNFSPQSQSGQSASPFSQGSPYNMHASQMNFSESSGFAAPGASQGSQTHMQTPHMNFFQPSGSHPSMPTGQFSQSSALPAPGASPGSQTQMQMAQPNYFASSGLQAPNYMQGFQTNIQTHQTNFLQPPGPQSAASRQGFKTNPDFTQQGIQPPSPAVPGSSPAVQGVWPANMQADQFGPPANMQMAFSHHGSQSVLPDPFTSQATAVSAGAMAKLEPLKKFEPKSAVWADTLSRGLVNFDISGHKTNPLADIGVDFDAINRKEKRLEPKSTGPPPTSTIVMGKAMGSGSGMGRAPQNPTMGSGMGMGAMGMGMGMGMGGGRGMHMGMAGGGGMGMGGGVGMSMGGGGMGMGGYGGNMNQPPMGMNMGMNMGTGRGMGMNMVGMGQGAPNMQQQQPSGQGMPPGYNPAMAMGPYGSQHQQPYGGGYR